uniref:Toxin candidate TRINITY_DN50048_c0_g1_i1 n=1 Tax=Pachycerianthus borealis TaxID=2736680 RepID=A0A7G7WYY7_9CNID|nr:toxin candidate TRINITY_DN50048_c0_g1_i1 [Pachycerianthus borealis]
MSPSSFTTLFIFCLVFCKQGVSQKDGFLKDCLDAHNKLRAKHSVPPLVWDEKLAQEALIVAENLAEDSMMIDHDEFNKTHIGENFGYFRNHQSKCMGKKEVGCTQCREIIMDWYKGKKFYDFNNPGKNLDLRSVHFTQVVWKASKKLGFGTDIDADGGLISVARYSPAGNVGDYKENVLSLTKAN